ncbi:TonB family protein [Pedobacter sp. LMG 31464]|uniref:TonB family protein n=1 Tax=Pedobacter planticolens TaxID=2679964 RepID=A0A923DXU7_9SPHI|nr:energy transducer TonB [Pedobacter planticolens]MBB2144453.1 TonB family protein [Pedobacter planticolens]
MFNNSSNLYGSEWLALVFSNRNKNYGAYELRSQSSSILTKSLFIAASIFVMLFVGPVIYGKLHKEVVVKVEYDHPVTMADPIHQMKKEEPKKEEPVKKAEPIKQQVEAKSVSISVKVVSDPVDDTPPPTTAQVQTSLVSSTPQEGAEGKGNAEPSPNTGGSGVGTAKEGKDDTEIYIGVENYPEFPGGMAAWSKFIQKNLRYPDMAQDAGVQGKVFLSFVVEKDGSITDVKVIKGIGYGCDDEAIRVIKKSPKWVAGKQNNQTVRVRYNMPIGYMLSQ